MDNILNVNVYADYNNTPSYNLNDSNIYYKLHNH